MKEETFLKYARKIKLESGNYYFVKKDGTIIDFLYDARSKLVASGSTKKTSNNYQALRNMMAFVLREDKAYGRKNMKDIIRKIRKNRRARLKRSPVTRR